MTVIAVDNDRESLRILEDAIREALPDSGLACFTQPDKALAYAASNPVDVAFLETRIGVVSGISLGRKLVDMRETTNIIFFTCFMDEAMDAYAVPASWYALKPVDANMVAEAMRHLRHPAPFA